MDILGYLGLVCRICSFCGLVGLVKVYSGVAYQLCKAWLNFGSGVNLSDDHACVINSECQDSQSASTWNCARSARI
jgi:hypothetical protein